MNWKSICFIVSGAVIQAIGVALLKYGMGLQNAKAVCMIAAFVLMAVGFPLYNLGLKKTKLSIAQP
ncbi:MAG TPA: hypothetical protein VHT34_10270, partial [Clostridia bacterium]|nr:hypothetical protein [Clostridia bacterium]